MADSIGMAILAAGEGRRMGKPVPKPLVPLLGKPLAEYVLESSVAFANNNCEKYKIGMVVGHQRELVIEHFSENEHIEFPVQEKQLGTADAVKSYFAGCSWAKEMDYTLVVCGDTPLIQEVELQLLWNYLQGGKFDGAAASFLTDNAHGYGRIVTNGEDKGFAIVEEKDANDDQRSINNVNSGLYLFKTSFLMERLALISNNNNSGEFYLTDVFGQDQNVGACTFRDSVPFMGVNDLIQLNTARLFMQYRINTSLLQNGIHILDPGNTWIDANCYIGQGTMIYPGSYIQSGSVVGANCLIEAGAIIKSSKLGEGVAIKAYSHLEGAVVGDGAGIGPYARLREGAHIGEASKIGNFVEVKKSVLDNKVSVSHLSYIGDAQIGENVNIGCGFITCNYDGENKSQTIIGKNSFIGSDTQMIAPVTVGESAYVASGSTINKNVGDGDFAVARGRQENKKGMAKRFLKGKWSVASNKSK